jgi:hypothetical protein
MKTLLRRIRTVRSLGFDLAGAGEEGGEARIARRR